MYVSRVPSVFESEGELLDDGVGEDFAGDAFDLSFGGALFEAIFEGQQEILSLPDIGDATVFHTAESICNCLPLGIQHGSFESYIDMSLHRV
jgi:hypothetical protein